MVSIMKNNEEDYVALRFLYRRLGNVIARPKRFLSNCAHSKKIRPVCKPSKDAAISISPEVRLQKNSSQLLRRI